MLKPGIYEQVVNAEIRDELSRFSKELQSLAAIDEAEASKILAQYLQTIVLRGLDYAQITKTHVSFVRKKQNLHQISSNLNLCAHIEHSTYVP